MMNQTFAPESALLLRRYLRWVIICTVTSIVLSAIVNTSLRAAERQLPLTAIASLSNVLIQTGLLSIAAMLARRNLSLALQITGVTLLISPIISAIITPETWAIASIRLIVLVMLMLPFISSQSLVRLISVVVVAILTVAALGAFGGFLPPISGKLAKLLVFSSGTPVIVLLLTLLWSFHRQLTHSLSEVQTSNMQLEANRASLESTVAARTSELSTTLANLEQRSHDQARLLNEVESQRQTIRELSVPILPVTRHATVLPLVGELDAERLDLLMDRALEAAKSTKAQHLLLDITGVPLIDTLAARGLIEIVQASRLLGTRVTIIGIRPEVAQALVSLGVDLDDLPTFSDLQTAMRTLYGVRSVAA